MNELILTEINERLKLYQLKGGLTFGTDAYLLYAYMKNRTKDTALDLGGGTGVISLLCAAAGKYRHIHTCEIQSEFYDIIRKNIKLNCLEERVEAHHADIRELTQDMFGKALDVVFTNPPYMKTDSGLPNEAEIKNIARHETRGTIYDFCAAASRLLRHGGYFYCVYRPDRATDLIDAMRACSLEPKKMTFVHARRSSPASLMIVEAKKGAGASMSITPPLIMYNDDGTYTAELNYIYDNGGFDEQY